jgi:hypothetical protein
LIEGLDGCEATQRWFGRVANDREKAFLDVRQRREFRKLGIGE